MIEYETPIREGVTYRARRSFFDKDAIQVKAGQVLYWARFLSGFWMFHNQAGTHITCMIHEEHAKVYLEPA